MKNAFDPTSPVTWILLAALLSMAVLEVAWARKHRRRIHDRGETAANLGILVGLQASRVFTLGWQLAVVTFLASFAPESLSSFWAGLLEGGPLEAAALFAACFLVTDFAYYWQHRLLHEVPLLWAFHHVHHSSPHMNLTTSFRLNWLSPLIGGVFLAPAVLVGFPVELIGLSLSVNLVFQFFLHTEAVGPLGALEGWVNTPSAHRVHHGQNAAYWDKNFGGVLMVWDRLFRSYVPETEPVVFGTPDGWLGRNPVKLVLVGFVLWARKLPGRVFRIRNRVRARVGLAPLMGRVEG